MRNASGAQKFFARVVLHGVLRFTKVTRTVTQGANVIIGLATDEKYKGRAKVLTALFCIQMCCLFISNLFYVINVLATDEEHKSMAWLGIS